MRHSLRLVAVGLAIVITPLVLTARQSTTAVERRRSWSDHVRMCDASGLTITNNGTT
jgi:hypothetical protein